MEPGKIAKHPAPEIGLRLGLMLDVNQNKTLLAPQLSLHHQVGLVPLAKCRVQVGAYARVSQYFDADHGKPLKQMQASRRRAWSFPISS